MKVILGYSQEGREDMVIELIRDDELSLEVAASKLNITQELLRDKLVNQDHMS